ncbi:MAG: DUF87 domain-containing protein [Patescibacteria group bacterium]
MFAWWQYFLFGYFALVALTFVFHFFIRFQQFRVLARQKYTVLMIRVSKDNELGPIVSEQILSTFHSIRWKVSFWKKLLGYSGDQISLEIANIDHSIRFYAVFPKKLRNLVEGQIYAQYTDVEIEEVEDYTQKWKLSPELLQNAAGIEFHLTDPVFDPIKRYPQFEDRISGVYADPIAGVTAGLAKLSHRTEQMWLQIIFRPLAPRWRTIYTRCAWILNKRHFAGIEAFEDAFADAFCTRKVWPKVVFFPLYFFLWIDSIFAGAPKDMMASEVSHQEKLSEEGTSKSHDKETAKTARMDKIAKLLYEVTIRAVYLPQKNDHEVIFSKLSEVAGSFKQFNIPYLNSLEVSRKISGPRIVSLYGMRFMGDPFVLNSEELATVWHLPNNLVQTPMIAWARAKKLEPPNDLPALSNTPETEFTTLGKTDFRGMNYEFGIKAIDRRRHVYIIGKTGMGKSTLLENMIFSDIQAGKGIAVIDPHGDLADAVMNFIPSHRTNDVILVDPSDREFPIAFNMLESKDPAMNSIISSGIVGVFKRLYGESWGPRLEYILRNAVLALLEYPNTTMLGITRILTDDEFRHRVVKKVTDPVVKAFWNNEFARFTDKQRQEAIAPILNKVGQFLSSSIIRNIIGQPKSSFDFRFAMDKGKIVIINLSKGKIGEDNSALLGSMFVTKFQFDAMSRADIPESERRDFYLYVDEFQNFATDSFATILSEARKYRLNLTMANQYIAQMPEEVRDAVFGNVGSIATFQVGYDDADYIAKQFGNEDMSVDLVSLRKYSAYIKLLVDGMPTKVFSMETLPPPRFEVEENRRDKVLRMSRERYSTPRAVVEDKIQRWSRNTSAEGDETGGR